MMLTQQEVFFNALVVLQEHFQKSEPTTITSNTSQICMHCKNELELFCCILFVFSASSGGQQSDLLLYGHATICVINEITTR